MNAGEFMYLTWAPHGIPWSAWAKPVLFAHVDSPVPPGQPDYRWHGQVRSLEQALAQFPDSHRGTALVVDLPGVDAIDCGVMLAQLGYRPVPLFNGSPGGPLPAVDMSAMLQRLQEATPRLAEMKIAPDAPPAFLLDALRFPRLEPPEGTFDNRWMTFPQDFPSARFLRAHGITGAVLVQDTTAEVREDLVHVLLRWQEAGIPLERISVQEGACAPLQLRRPKWFRSLFYRFLVLVKLRRNSLGGFGAYVPVPSQSHG